MNQDQLYAYRTRMTVLFLHRLVLRTVLLGPVLQKALSIEESRDSLKDWLDQNSAISDQAYGEHFQDAALTALYADEVKDVIEKMKEDVDSLAAEVQKLMRKPT
jgi:hypothetical protein